MSSIQDCIALLRIYTLRMKNHIVDFDAFAAFVRRYSEQHLHERSGLSAYLKDTGSVLTSQIEECMTGGRCAVSFKEGKISQIIFPDFFAFLLQREYAKIETKGDLPFPSEDNLGISVPNDILRVVNIKTDFVPELGEQDPDTSEVLRLVFPEGIRSMAVPSSMVNKPLARLAAGKIQHYLSSQRNAGYMMSKLRSISSGREQLLRDMVNNIIAGKRQPMESLFNPSDFSFRFWAHLANAIIQEYREKTDKLEIEHNYCQAAYLIGYYNVYYRGINQRERDAENALKGLETTLHKAPYVYSLNDIYGFKDGQGVPLTKKYSEDRLQAFLEEKTAPPGPTGLPEILRLRTADKREFYIAKEVVLPLTLKKVDDTGAEYRKRYISLWEKELREYQKTDLMKSDESFEEDVSRLLREEDPLLHCLLNYDLLYLCLQDNRPNEQIAREVERILDTAKKQLIPLRDLFNLSRKDLLSRARNSLPFWQSMTFFHNMMRFFKTMLGGGKRRRRASVPKQTGSAAKVLGNRTDSSRAGPSSSETGQGGPHEGRSAKARQAALQQTVARLKVEMIGADANVNQRLAELIERWNPLFDPVAKANLVEDVNAMIRDYVRKLRRGFLVRHPDVQRIRSLAESLAENEAFLEIKRKDFLRRYIEAYMLKLLG